MTRKESRTPERLFGIHPVASALRQHPGRVRRLIIAEGVKNRRVQELVGQARTLGITVEARSRAELDRDSGGVRHQDVIAEFEAGNLFGEKDLDRVLDGVEGTPLILVLDGVQDPHNLGACLRTAEAAGVDLVISTKDRTAGLSAVARRAAAGAAETIPLLVATNLARVLRRLKERGIWLAGTADGAEQGLHDVDLGGPLALVVGGEGQGMRRLTADTCDYLLRIPMRGTVSSLNVSVATGVCLFEIVRQRSNS